MVLKDSDAPILIVMGQSNAHGHGTKLPQEERITVPLQNVWGLSRQDNQAYGKREVIFSKFRSEGMNLGEIQDNTCCLANYFAVLWQRRIDSGEKLPDLYIVQISIGAQGIAPVEASGNNMWWPERAPVLVPGILEEVNISLYPLAQQVLSLTVDSLKQMGKTPKILGLHWNQWETEAQTGGEAISRCRENYTALFSGFRKALGVECPIVLYRPLSEIYQNPQGVESLTKLFESLVEEDNFRMMDCSKAPFFNPQVEDKGIFQPDLVHYAPHTHQWFAQMQMDWLD